MFTIGVIMRRYFVFVLLLLVCSVFFVSSTHAVHAQTKTPVRPYLYPVCFNDGAELPVYPACDGIRGPAPGDCGNEHIMDGKPMYDKFGAFLGHLYQWDSDNDRNECASRWSAIKNESNVCFNIQDIWIYETNNDQSSARATLNHTICPNEWYSSSQVGNKSSAPIASYCFYAHADYLDEYGAGPFTTNTLTDC